MKRQEDETMGLMADSVEHGHDDVHAARSSESQTSSSPFPYRDSFSNPQYDERLPDYYYPPAQSWYRCSFFDRLFASFGRRRQGKGSILQRPGVVLGDTKDASSLRSSNRGRPRWSRIMKRAIFITPVIALMFFGILHILQAVFSRAQLFLDLENYDDFLPQWGMPGQIGDGLAQYPTDATRDVIPIQCHSHNDYWRKVPVFDAIHWGCTGIEADVWLLNDELFVGHNTASLTPKRTFRNLYVNPVVELLDSMNPNTTMTSSNTTTKNGVFDTDPEQTLVLLIDFKTGGPETYPVVLDQLSALRDKDYLTYHDGKTLHPRPVTIVGTGNTPFDLILNSTTRREIFFDAPLDQLYEPAPGVIHQPENGQPSPILLASSQSSSSSSSSTPSYNSTNSYYASVSFQKAIGFVWRGELSARQLDTIRAQIRGAHRRGLKVRYWDTPSWPVNVRNHVWATLMNEGADMLNVDDLKGAAVENWKARVHHFW